MVLTAAVACAESASIDSNNAKEGCRVASLAASAGSTNAEAGTKLLADAIEFAERGDSELYRGLNDVRMGLLTDNRFRYDQGWDITFDRCQAMGFDL